MSRTHVTCTINGDEVEFLCDQDESLLNALRDEVGLTGSKEGCGTGDCGACSVLLDDRVTCACLVFAPEAEGRTVVTVEGLAGAGELHPLQQAWIDEQVPQCGYCQNGQIMTAKALLDRNPAPTDAEIRQAMNGVLCRCMTYYRIQAAVRRAADTTANAPTCTRGAWCTAT